MCDGILLPPHPLPPPLVPRAVTPVCCASQGKKGGLGKIWVWMRPQLCVVRPAFLLCWVCAFNDFFVNKRRKGEMLTLLPELNVACMVTISIKIKQKKKVYICSYICGKCTIKMYIWIKIEGHVPVYFGVMGQNSALCLTIQPLPTCLTLPPPWTLPPSPVVF